jgi:hypothetical protein
MVRQVLSFARGVEGERVALQPKHLIKEIVSPSRSTSRCLTISGSSPLTRRKFTRC